jgi:hypothetical protein
VLFASECAPGGPLDAAPDPFAVRSVPSFTGPPRRSSWVHPARTWIPSRVSHPPRDRPTCRSELTSPGLSTPSDGILALAPCGAGCPFPAPVPLSGFLNLSAVSWQARVPRPCFGPQPSLSVSPSRAFPSSKSWSPLEAHQLPCGHPPTCRSDRALPEHPGFHRRQGLSTPLPGSPPDHGLPFREVSPTSRSPWVSRGSTVPDGRLHPLRSVPPPTNPFTPSRANPRRRPLLSWVSSPSETLTEPRILDPPRPVDLRSRPARRPCKTGVARDQRPSGPKSPRLGDPSPQRCPKTHPGPAAQRFAAGWSRRRPRLLGAAPRRLSTASPSPLALDRDRANPTWSDLRGIGAFGSWCISGEIHLPLVRFHASSST